MDPLLGELVEAGDGAEQVEVIIKLQRGDVVPPDVQVVTRFGDIATCRLRRDHIRRTWEDPGVVSVKAPRCVAPEPDVSEINLSPESQKPVSQARRPEALEQTGRGVVIGIVDWGCDFAHPNFRSDDGSTRLLALWDQSNSISDRVAAPYGYGVAYSREDINRALRSPNPYQSLGYHPADGDPSEIGAHGTHCCDIAAGNGRVPGGPIGVAPQSDIIFVHLAARGISRLLNLGDSVRILEALDFIAKVAGDRPWVINLSVGRCGGPHTGLTLVEQGMDALLLEAPGRCICLSTGNYFGEQMHAAGRLRPGEERTLTWRTDKADFTPNELEIWYSGHDSLMVEMRPPNGQAVFKVSLGEKTSIQLNGREVGRIYHRLHDPSKRENHVDAFLYPAAPAGAWQVKLTGVDIVDGRFHAWVERDNAYIECQSRFDQKDAVSLTTTGTICNGFRTIAVGAYDSSSPDLRPALFSSSAPTADGRSKPDLLAPGEHILAARSAPRDVQGKFPLLTFKSGTSMAAPYVTGCVALMFEAARRPLWIHETRRLLLSNTRRLPTAKEFADRIGNGYLDIKRAVEAANTFTALAFPSKVTISSAYRHNGAGKFKGRSMESKMQFNVAGNFDRLEEVIKESTPRAVSERNFLAEIMRTNEAPVLTFPDPDRLYRAIAFCRNGPLSAMINENFTVLARPGEKPVVPPQVGDILLRVALGEPGLGHVALLSDSTLWPHVELVNSALKSESQQPGFYATVIEGGVFHHTRGNAFARRILDSEGRMPPYQLLLRPRMSPMEAENVEMISAGFDKESLHPEQSKPTRGTGVAPPQGKPHPTGQRKVETAISGDVRAMVNEILTRPEKARQVLENRFGSEFSAELMRTLAPMKEPETVRAYQQIVAWNLEFFFKHGPMQDLFIRTIIALRGPGSEEVRADVTLSIVDEVQQGKHSIATMQKVAEFFSSLIGGEIGVEMVNILENRDLRRQVRQIMAHILKWGWLGQRTIGELLGKMSYKVALQATTKVRSSERSRYSSEDFFQAQSSTLGRMVAHVEMAVDEWALARAKGEKKAAAAHGAAIVNFAVDVVMGLLPGNVSKVVESTVNWIRSGVKKLELYESGRERAPDDPRKELNEYMLEAANLPFFQMMDRMEDHGELEEGDLQVLVERFRLNLKAGREDEWSRVSDRAFESADFVAEEDGVFTSFDPSTEANWRSDEWVETEEEEDKTVDRTATEAWAIGSLVSAGFIVGYSAFALVNRDTGREHLLHIPTIGLTTKLGVAGGGAPSYTMFETKRPVSFADFDGIWARVTSANIGVLYGYSIVYLTLWDGLPYVSPQLAYVKMAGWGAMIPGGSIAHGVTKVTYGSGRRSGTVRLRLVPQPQDFPPDPRLASIRMAAQESPKITVPNELLFDFDKYNLKPDATRSLVYIADLLNNRRKLPVIIEGHTDSKGSTEHNMELSRQRALAVKQWFIAHKVYKAAEFRVEAYGESQPIAPNQKLDGSDNPEERRKNRRVVIRAEWNL